MRAAPQGKATGPAMCPGGILLLDVVIIGAGFAGLGMGMRLARRGRESFLICERAETVGGTWRDNHYPGVACDVPAPLYAFSFRPNLHWTHVFASGGEIQTYLQECARAEGLLPHLRFGAELQQAHWHAPGGYWHIITSRGVWHARVLVIAAGRLSEPAWPDIAGLADFPGPVWHTARWDHQARLSGRRVGVVGTGASAAQIVPHLADTASQLVLFQRSPPYVLPRGGRAYTRAERRQFARHPDILHRLRAQLLTDADQAIAARQYHQPDLDQLRARALQHLATNIPSTRLRSHLTPSYEIGCKRVLLSDTFYPALMRQHVHLEPSALTQLRGPTAFAARGATYQLDVLILATGFHATRPAFAHRIRGRHQLLADKWAHGMTAHASTTVHGFPNLFVLDGPNASLGHNSAIPMIETQLDYVLGALDHLAAHPHAALEVTAAAEAAYTTWIAAMSQNTVWLQGGCHSWYVDDRSGRLTLLWPGSAHSFFAHNATFDPNSYHLHQAAQPADHPG